eukprot:TRINITY_DN13534_c0_g1_i2.p1 TRINITY_DN13534_c0_g1~~TRINITY_DN13534_c0_g1_i2.p1  ORF type:complete len:372 (-),score=44.69 TRINITY_DN13534_c0_g1_i2:183-1298(-)
MAAAPTTPAAEGAARALLREDDLEESRPQLLVPPTAPAVEGEDRADGLTLEDRKALEEKSREVKAMWHRWLPKLVASLYVLSATCAIVGARLGDCRKGTPDFLLYIALAMVAVSTMIQLYSFSPFIKLQDPSEPKWCFQLCFKKSHMWSMAALFIEICIGNLETLDFFTDGQQVAQAFLCDVEIHETWVETFRKSALPGFASSFVDKAHMWGVMVMTIILASLAGSLITYSMGGGACVGLSWMAGVGGFDVVFPFFSGQRTLFRARTVLLFETGPGLYLQTSLFSLTFDHTDDNTKRKQLLSLGLGAAALVKSAAETVGVLNEVPGRGRAVVFGLPLLVVVSVVAVCTARVYFSYMCNDHLWNFTTGCVSA